MVTFAQAQERAEEWINGDVPAYQHREVRVREFDFGFVVWAEDRADGPRSDGGGQRLVIARDSGEATLWPALPVGEVVRRYEEAYGRDDAAADPAPEPPARVDLNQTSFLLSPPEWLQEAADRLGIPDRRGGAAAESGGSGTAASDGAGVGAGAGAGASAGAEGRGGSGSLPETQAGVPAGAAGAAPGAPAGATPWAGTDTNADAGDDRSVPLPDTVFAQQLSEVPGDTPPPSTTPDAKTALMSGGSALPPTAMAPAIGDPNAPGGSQGAGVPGVPGTPPPGVPGMPGTPPPGAPQGSTPPPAQPYGYPQGQGQVPAAPGTPPQGVPHGSTPPPAASGAPGQPSAH
ncbi:hypothetical protein QC282_31620, partial [Streptomyces sp. DH24]|nr:hypothetical protein [Streptomyces sp. DH24]